MKETCIYYESKHLELLHARAHHFGKKIIVIIYKHEMLVPKTKKTKKIISTATCLSPKVDFPEGRW